MPIYFWKMVLAILMVWIAAGLVIVGEDVISRHKSIKRPSIWLRCCLAATLLAFLIGIVCASGGDT